MAKQKKTNNTKTAANNVVEPKVKSKASSKATKEPIRKIPSSSMG